MLMSAGMFSMDSVVLMVYMAIICDTSKSTELSFAVNIMIASLKFTASVETSLVTPTPEAHNLLC